MTWWVVTVTSILQTVGASETDTMVQWALVLAIGITVVYALRNSYFAYKMGSNHAGVPGTLGKLLVASRTETGGATRTTDERVTVEGKTKPLAEPLQTPYSEEPTLAVRWDVYDIEKEHTWWTRLLTLFRNPFMINDPRYGRWIRTDVEDGREADPFVIDDGSGPLLVDPSDSQFVFATDRMPEEYGGTSRRYDEFHLEPNQFAVASGTVIPTSQLDHDFDVPRADLPDYALTAPDDGQLRLADTDKFGLAYRLPRWNLGLAALALVVIAVVAILVPI